MENKAEKRALILENAVKLFGTKGYDGVGVQEICQQSGITKPTLYYYFSSKAGLLSAIILEKGQAFLEELTEAAEYNHDFVGSLEQIMRSVIYFSKENSDFFLLACSLEVASQKTEAASLFKDFSKKISDIYLDFFVKSANEIEGLKDKEELLSRIFQQICISISLDLLSERMEFRPEIVPNAVEAFAHGVI